ncbi:MAG: hypothetical protein FJY29_13595 [Betaproteobacteria bacterium]|nr:hypothetical protein [Betaproteobacteria bacterium]
MNRILFINMMAAFTLFAACKKPASDAGAGTNSSASQQSPQQQQQQRGEFPTQFDLQEFYEITRASYLKKLRAFGEDGLSQAELAFMAKFNINTKYVGQMVDLAETMFQLLESGRYAQKLHGISRMDKVSRNAPKGLTDKDLEQFFQLVKMDYFRRITKRPTPEMDARETNFYARASAKSESSHASPADVLLLSSDLFDKIEGIK